ncbi:MAG: transcriptional repressor [Clostridia bacterium]|nr:transcriptional repressor [Clostridia bacterium]
MRGEYSTKQREAILDFLKESNTHLTASDIISHLKEQGVKIGVATVYRALERLERDGVVKKMVVENGACACYQYLDGRECTSHFHLKCIHCGGLIHLSCEFLEGMEKHIYKEHGFKVSSGRTVIYGICSKCASGEENTTIQ